MSEIGPVQYMIVAFPGNRFQGQIAPALADLVESNTIRIIDLAFVAKNADGEIAAFELSELDEQVRAGLENIVGGTVEGLFNEDDLAAAAEELDPDSSAALLIWEDVWAARLAQAIRDAGGELLDLERVPHEVVQAARDFATENV